MATSQPPTGIEAAFTCFSALPTELRLKIWGFAALKPRYLEIYQLPKTTGIGANWYLRPAQRPALLSTSRESRSEVEFRHRYGRPEHYLFNPDIDVICVSSDWYIWMDDVLPALEGRLAGRVRRLAITVSEWRFEKKHEILLELRDALPTAKGLIEIQVIFARRAPAEAVGFKEVKYWNKFSWLGFTQDIFEREFKRIIRREKGGEWEMPSVRYGSFEYREVIPKVKQMLKEGEEMCEENEN